MEAGWVVPTMVYIGTVGSMGVASKLAFRTLSWRDLILWTGIGYILLAIGLLATGTAELRFAEGTPWAALTATSAIVGLVSIFVALTRGDASQVVPVSATYPAVTMVLAALVLSEDVSPLRVGGVALVIAGVIVLTRAP